MEEGWLAGTRLVCSGNGECSQNDEIPFVKLFSIVEAKVAYTAWRQERQARNLVQYTSDKLFEPSEARPARRNKWSKVHGFYAVMGGFAFDTDDSEQKFMPGSRTRLTLTTRALRFLAKHRPDLIPDLSTEEIEDKSKASGLAKTLVCLQASWFCIQCINRLIARLSISLLELNTFGHAICTLLIYILWWHKPLDVAEPSLMQGTDARQICALMCLASKIDGRREFDLLHSVPIEPKDETEEEEDIQRLNMISRNASDIDETRRIRYFPSVSNAGLPQERISNTSNTSDGALRRRRQFFSRKTPWLSGKGRHDQTQLRYAPTSSWSFCSLCAYTRQDPMEDFTTFFKL